MAKYPASYNTAQNDPPPDPPVITPPVPPVLDPPVESGYREVIKAIADLAAGVHELRAEVKALGTRIVPGVPTPSGENWLKKPAFEDMPPADLDPVKDPTDIVPIRERILYGIEPVTGKRTMTALAVFDDRWDFVTKLGLTSLDKAQELRASLILMGKLPTPKVVQAGFGSESGVAPGTYADLSDYLGKILLVEGSHVTPSG